MKDESMAAFPRPGYFNPDGPMGSDCDAYEGMTLRDWFAGQALIGIYANSILSSGIAKDAHDEKESPISAIADMAYLAADAMLAQRSK